MRMIAALALVLMSASAMSDNGLIQKKSAYSAADTLDRLEAVLRDKGLTVFARIDHAAGAAGAGMSLLPTELIIFGSPKMGTPLMASQQTLGIDLPMKVLAYEDEAGQTWVVYNAPSYIAGRHGVADHPKIIDKMTGALDAFTNKATQPES